MLNNVKPLRHNCEINEIIRKFWNRIQILVVNKATTYNLWVGLETWKLTQTDSSESSQAKYEES